MPKKPFQKYHLANCTESRYHIKAWWRLPVSQKLGCNYFAYVKCNRAQSENKLLFACFTNLFDNIQSRPIKMRTPILYLANRWTKFKMLLTSNRFLYLIRFLLLSFPLIPQFIAQFRSICLFLCSSPYFLPVATKWELEQSMHCPLCHCCHSFLFSPSERTKWRSKKVLKSLS